jgi:hypothetical protein
MGCYHCGKSKVQCTTENVGGVARPRKGKGPARRKVKKAESSSGDSGEEQSPRRFTQREKGKSKGEFSLSSFINPLTHIPIAIDVDIEMADPDPRPAPAPAAVPVANPSYRTLAWRLEQVEHDMYKQARWLESSIIEPLARMQEMQDALNALSNRMDNLEAYLGLQNGVQPIVLYNGI